ncbi:ATPase [Nostoc minutum NIES-26]|uniref:ATPase n=1 Tax=Nostoc minutum NIES-26 TaxID=1844469 RepID=A0A367QYX8_9NOSO|nr:ATPase [Nostoc minutum NIES-26]
MILTTFADWYEANYCYVTAATEAVRQALKSYIARQKGEPEVSLLDIQLQLADIEASMPAPPALSQLCHILGLSSFERDILLMCVAMNFTPNFPSLCADAQGNEKLCYPTFALALEALPDASWSALRTESPLQRWQLIQIGDGIAPALCSLQIDKSILCYLLGEPSLPEKLQGLFKSIAIDADNTCGELQPSHQKIASQLAAIWLDTTESLTSVVQLCGLESITNVNVVTTACYFAGINLHIINAYVLATKADELKQLMVLWSREALLSDSALLLDCQDISTTTTKDAATISIIKQLVDNINGKLIITCSDRLPLSHPSLIAFDVPKLKTSEQLAIWQDALGTSAVELNGRVETLVSQFNLSHLAIFTAVETAKRVLKTNSIEQTDTNNLAVALWDACRTQARPQLDDLAQRIDTHATWDQLVLQEQQMQILQNIVTHVRQRLKVYFEWGFASNSGRGLGISALFTGESGLGKTFAAEVIANELRLDLYRIDLSAVVSKYIGETEKNLRRIFDTAETAGAVLLFDEADALFGKRTQVRDSRDRNANMETNYLLQRIEAYTGLAILTTNLSDAIDSAFLRRIRFIVRFEFPYPQERIQMWKRIFPAQTPTEGLDYNKLSRLDASGATIRNVAMNAAFLAASAGEPVMMKHLLAATRAEYSKIGQLLSDNQVKGWA